VKGGKVSENFGFLAQHDELLAQLASLAERYFTDDPNTCLIKLRQFGEALAQQVAASAGVWTSHEENQLELLNRLKASNILPRQSADLFHAIRRAGNTDPPP
jgi:type I restriction enzyme R subunit